MKRFRIGIVQYGDVIVEAENEDEARLMAFDKPDEIDWYDCITDTREYEEEEDND